MSVFVDTSGFLAVLDSDDQEHEEAKGIWTYLVTTGQVLHSSNYVLLESFALIQRRLGLEAIRAGSYRGLPTGCYSTAPH